MSRLRAAATTTNRSRAKQSSGTVLLLLRQDDILRTQEVENVNKDGGGVINIGQFYTKNYYQRLVNISFPTFIC